MRPMALNVPLAMLMSLVVAFTVTPWMAYHLAAERAVRRGGRAPNEPKPARRLSRSTAACSASSSTRRCRALGDARRRPRAARLAAASCSRVGHVPLKMLPFDNKNELQVVLDLPEGTTLEAPTPRSATSSAYLADRARGDRLRILRRHREPDRLQRPRAPLRPARRAPNLADMRVNLVAKDRRTPADPRRSRCGCATTSRRSRERAGAALKIVEVPPGPAGARDARRRGPRSGEPRRTRDLIAAGARASSARLARETGRRRRRRLRRGRSIAARLRPRQGEGGAARRRDGRGRPHACGWRSPAPTPATVHDAAASARRSALRLRLDRAQRSGAAELGAPAGREAGAAASSRSPSSAASASVDRRQPIYPQGPGARRLRPGADVAGRAPAEVVLALERALAARPLPRGIGARLGGRGRVEDHARRVPRPRPRLRGGARRHLRAAGDRDRARSRCRS